MGTQYDMFERATESTSFSARDFADEVARDLRNERAILLEQINEATKLLAEIDKLIPN